MSTNLSNPLRIADRHTNMVIRAQMNAGGSGRRLKVQFTDTTEEVITFDLTVDSNSGINSGIGFVIVSMSSLNCPALSV